MKRIFLLLSTSLLGLSMAFAGSNGLTEEDDKPATLTINVGMANAKFNTSGESSRTDWMLGIQKDVQIAPLFRLNTGLYYNRLGSSSEFSETKLNYLQIPVGLKVKLGPVYGLGGFSAAYRVAAKTKIDGGDFQTIDKNQVNRLDFGVHLGLGFKFLIFSLEGRYNWGLSDISNGKDTDGADIANQYFQLMLGVALP